MKIAVSNIAWKKEEEVNVVKILKENLIGAVEVAPAKIGAEPILLNDSTVSNYREFWADHGIQIPAMQALLFGSTGLAIFETAIQRQKTLDYLKRIIEIGFLLGAKALVFGSPKNRKVNGLSKEAVEEIAIPFFKELGDYAHQNKTHLCLEPNPPIYDCDFINTTQEAIDLVIKVDSKGFMPHYDSAALALGNEPLTIIDKYVDLMVHFHASEAYLNPVVSNKDVDHRSLSEKLKQNQYQNYVSLEMKEVALENAFASLKTAIQFVKEIYGVNS